MGSTVPEHSYILCRHMFSPNGEYLPNTSGVIAQYGCVSCRTRFLREAWHSDIPKRKSQVTTLPGQRRIAVYNFRSLDWFKASWQGELTVPPRQVLWARRRRKER